VSRILRLTQPGDVRGAVELAPDHQLVEVVVKAAEGSHVQAAEAIGASSATWGGSPKLQAHDRLWR
jgi:hypothetical protein